MIDAVVVAGGGSLADGGSNLQITKTDGLSNLVAGQGITDRLDRKNVATNRCSGLDNDNYGRGLLANGCFYSGD
jgi:hypothetical protein